MLVAATAVGATVIGLLFFALVRQPSVQQKGGRGSARAFTLIGGGVIPLLILGSVFGYSLFVMRDNQGQRDPDLVVRVVAHQFDYSFSYPGHTAPDQNELHLPSDRLIKLELSSEDVIHSFWVPELQGKMDMFHGRTTIMWIEDAQPGLYEARCAEFCGLKHALMRLPIRVESPAEFDAWLDSPE